MTEELCALIERARNHKITPGEVFEQRVSFVYGQQDHDSLNPLSKAQVREKLTQLYGRPPCPKCEGVRD